MCQLTPRTPAWSISNSASGAHRAVAKESETPRLPPQLTELSSGYAHGLAPSAADRDRAAHALSESVGGGLAEQRRNPWVVGGAGWPAGRGSVGVKREEARGERSEVRERFEPFGPERRHLGRTDGDLRQCLREDLGVCAVVAPVVGWAVPAGPIGWRRGHRAGDALSLEAWLVDVELGLVADRDSGEASRWKLLDGGACEARRHLR